MAIYTVQDTTMQALGDALRKQKGLVSVSGEEKSNLFHLEIKNTADLNIEDLQIENGSYYYILPLPKYNSWYSFAYSYHNGSRYRMPIYLRFYNSDGSIKFENDIITIYNQSAEDRTIKNIYYTNSQYYYGYDPYLVISIPSFDLEIDFILDMYVLDRDNGIYYDLPTFTPLEMVDEINNFTIFPEDKFLLTGNLSSRFATSRYEQGAWAWTLSRYYDKWYSKDITNLYQTFACIPDEKLYFDINCANNQTINCDSTFYACDLKELPKLNIPKLGSTRAMFQFCNFQEITDDQWNVTDYHRTSSGGNMFYGCSGLRRLSKKLLNNLYDNNTAYYNSIYYNTFCDCYTIDEINELGVSQGALTSNCFQSTFQHCNRLKELTFLTNEDGTPQIVNWQSQVIDLSYYVGYRTSGEDYILNQYGGITADKKVYDDATYQALKDDPDWYSMDINYSRYNHDSAVNTINSLPDCSGSGGTNTIKFQGASGAKTDGGAINTLTEEEIAVASAKGWTVSLV